MKKALVLGGGGFIGSHMVSRLVEDGFWVKAVDLKFPIYSKSKAHEFVIGDLTDQNFCNSVFDHQFDEVYQFAADMGGAGYVFTGENDANIMLSSAKINLNVLETCVKAKPGKIFYSSSACIYPEYNQNDPLNPLCSESSAYPANPDSEYGWEKLFSERLYLAFKKNYGLQVRIGRYHNIYGPESEWEGGREKSPAAICRKIKMADYDGIVEIWGDGEQTRSFLYIDECIDGTIKLMKSEFSGPINIGSDIMITINNLVNLVSEIANKKIYIKNINGPTGVRGRNSDNTLIKEKLSWVPSMLLKDGMEKTYKWISAQIDNKSNK